MFELFSLKPLSRAAVTAGLVAGCLVANSTAAHEIEGDILWAVSPTIVVESNDSGTEYVRRLPGSGDIYGQLKIRVVAEPIGRIENYTARVTLEQSFFNEKLEHGWSGVEHAPFHESFGFAKPKWKVRVHDFRFTVSEYDDLVIQACNNHASRLRGQGLSNSRIFAEDRVTTLTIQIDVSADFTVYADYNRLYGTNPVPKINVLCKRAPAKVEVVDLSTQGQHSLSGACSLKLSGSLRTTYANTAVRFRYAHGNGEKSDVKTVTTGGNRTAAFTHTFPMPKGKYNGVVRLEGVGDDFESVWKSYSVDCPTLNAEKAAPQGRFVASFDVTGQKEGMFDGYVCPLEVETVSRLNDVAETMDPRLILRMESVDYPLIAPQVEGRNFHIPEGKSVSMSYSAKVEWGPLPHTPGKPPSQTMKLRFFVKQGEETLKTLEKTVELKCRQPDVKLSLQVTTQEEKMVNSFICPEKVRLRGLITAADPSEIRYSMLLDPSFGPSAVQQQETRLVAGQNWAYNLSADLNWNGSPSIGGQPPKMKVKGEVKVRRQDDDTILVQKLDEVELQCRARPTGLIGQGASNNRATLAPMSISKPQGTILRIGARRVKIQLAGGNDGAVYELTFYRQEPGGLVQVSGAGIPAEMTGRELRFDARKLTGSRQWRLKVCPAGAVGSACKTTQFELGWE